MSSCFEELEAVSSLPLCKAHGVFSSAALWPLKPRLLELLTSHTGKPEEV
jgi:hypothetical protein